MAQRFIKKDVSSTLRNSESGMIDQVMVTTNVEGQRFVKVKVPSQRCLQRILRSRLHRFPLGCASCMWSGNKQATSPSHASDGTRQGPLTRCLAS